MKDEAPDNIYFFDNGKVTIIPGEEFGLTMGDFSKMSDAEIWGNYETVKDAYIEKYTTAMVENYTTSIQNEINDLESWVQGIRNNLETVSSSRGTGDYDWYLMNSSKFFWDSFYDSSEEEMGKEIPHTLYDKLSFAQGLTSDEDIYDSTYNCIATTGSGSFMTREKMDIDATLDSEYILIDLSDDELNELFKEEITARYE